MSPPRSSSAHKVLSLVEEGLEGRVGHHDVGRSDLVLSVPFPGIGGAHHLDEGVGQALVPAGLAVGGIGPGLGLEAGAHGDIGLFGQLGADGAQRCR